MKIGSAGALAETSIVYVLNLSKEYEGIINWIAFDIDGLSY